MIINPPRQRRISTILLIINQLKSLQVLKYLKKDYRPNRVKSYWLNVAILKVLSRI